MKIAYIGPKKEKLDLTSGSRQVFRRFEPLEVEKEHALRLLRFPTVYVEEKDLEQVMEEMQARLEMQEKKAAQKADLVKKEDEAASREIQIGDNKIDLRKYTQIKLETLVESEDLDLAPKGAGEKVPEYCDRVFAAFQAKQEG